MEGDALLAARKKKTMVVPIGGGPAGFMGIDPLADPDSRDLFQYNKYLVFLMWVLFLLRCLAADVGGGINDLFSAIVGREDDLPKPQHHLAENAVSRFIRGKRRALRENVAPAREQEHLPHILPTALEGLRR